MNTSIALVIGSLRKGSFNRKLANALVGLAPQSLKFVDINIGDLPLYNQDLDDEGKPPQQWITFRQKLKPCQGVLFVTPEYNRSVPGVLKNAIDVGSRPFGESVWEGKAGAVISASPGSIGGFGANHHLRQALVFLNVPTLQQPESYVSHVGDLFDEKGNITNTVTADFLQKFINAFANWVFKIRGTT